MSTSFLYHAFNIIGYKYLRTRYELNEITLCNNRRCGKTFGCWMGHDAYYDYPISTAKLEGTNNKIKTMQKKLMDLEIWLSLN